MSRLVGRSLATFLVTVSVVGALVTACGLFGGGLDSDVAPDGAPVIDSSLDGMQTDVDATSDMFVPDVQPDAGPVSPDEVSGLVFWLRGDDGIELDADGGDAGEPKIRTWRNRDGGDPNRDAVQNKPFNQPTFPGNVAAFNSRPAVHYGDPYGKLATGVWSAPLSPPATLFIVGVATPQPGAFAYFVDGRDAANRLAVGCNPDRGFSVQMFGNTPPVLSTWPAGGKCNVPMIAVAVFNGNGSQLYVSSTAPVANMNIPTAGWLGASIGNAFPDPSVLPYSPQGYVAEVAAWNRALTPTEILRLEMYGSTRYAITLQ